MTDTPPDIAEEASAAKQDLKESKNPEGVGDVYDRGNSGVPGERECKRRRMMVRFRCGNEERENRNWKLQNVL
jgi:hypothetical protein